MNHRRAVRAAESTRILGILLAVIALGLAPAVARQVEKTGVAPLVLGDETGSGDESAETDEAPVPGAERVEEGEWLFRELRFEEAIAALGGALDDLASAPEDERARALISKAYDLRAQSHLSLGRSRAAEADFEALVKNDPLYMLDELTVSPKIVERFRGIREKLVGFLSVTCRPRDAVLTIDGRPAGTCPVLERPVLAGEHAVTGEKVAFDPASETVSVSVGEIAGVRLTLTPNARTVHLRTVPPGVEVFVDDEPAGVTPPGPGGAVGDDVTSEPLVIEALGPGEHRFRFRRECWAEEFRSFMVVVDLLDVTPVVLEPVRLSPAVSAVSVRSDPVGGLVLIDGEEAGRTPLLRRDVCAGDRTFEVRFADGIRWLTELTVLAGEALELQALPRPDLSYRLEGFSGDSGDPAAPTEAGRLRSAFSNLRRFNAVEEAADPGPAVLTLAARRIPVPGGPARIDVRLGSAHGAEPETWRFAGAGDPEFAAFLEALDTPFEPVRPASGLVLIDTGLAPRPVVLEARSGSPAARAGLIAGDVVTTVDGEPAGPAREVTRRLAAARAGAPARLGIRGADGKREVAVFSEPAAVLVPFARSAARDAGDAPLSYHKIAVESALASAISPAGARRDAARLNFAAALLHFGRETLALEGPLSRGETKAGAGISAGTVHYLRGVALERLGRTAEAAAAFGLAAASPEATLDSLEGAALAEAAKARAAAISAAPSRR